MDKDNSELQYTLNNTILPSISNINFDIVRMCLAPSQILDLNSKSNLEKRTHRINFRELSFKLDAELTDQE